MFRIAQDLNKEIESRKKIQTEEIEKMKTVGIGTASFTNRVQEVEERISSVEDTMENGYIRQRKC